MTAQVLFKNLSKAVRRAVSHGALNNSHKVAIGRSKLPPALFARAFSATGKPHPSEAFLNGTNSVYVEEMYRSWREDPKSVHKSWDVYFRNVEAGFPQGAAFLAPPSLQPGVRPVPVAAAGQSAVSGDDALGLSYLVRAYQVRGHEISKLDPLELTDRERPRELHIEEFGFTEKDLDRDMVLPRNFASGFTGVLSEIANQGKITLRQVVNRLEQIYCGTIGVEYMHMGDRDRCNWIRSHVESMYEQEMSKAKKMHILERHAFGHIFEQFFAQKYNTTKRFGVEGGETLIPGLKFMVDRASELGVSSIVIGMPHRGRLNVLANVVRKPLPQLFKEFQGTHFDLEHYENELESGNWSSSGDVKYHLGTSYDRTYPDGRTVHLSLVANPSHLEAVDPVVVGKARAKQFYMGDDDEAYTKVLPVLLHGDAAFCGQGVVYETMHFSHLDNYHTGGTIHVVVNNQIGFTTDPKQSRSSQYSTDVGKAFEIPILHVNADDPIAVVKVFELAAEWRQEWGEDIIIDLVCYRKNGHNELDQPMFTQPHMYKKISAMKPALHQYADDLVAKGVASKEEVDAAIANVQRIFELAFEDSKNWETSKKDWLANQWESFKSPKQQSRIRTTGVDQELLKKIGSKLCDFPEGFTLHSNLRRIFQQKKQSITDGEGIDWGTAEALAWGTLLLEGNHVRISGQDVERGTFSHRHSILHDQNSNEKFVPLNKLAQNILPGAPLKNLPPNSQAKFIASNSSLSEYGVLGFEVGYSLENPNALVMWEAQFGDFVNGAQIMIDQFICAGEDKWMRQCGIVMLLPHGYEGQGAEHSSARIERFLQNVDDDEDEVPEMDEETRMQIQHTNWQVVYCSTPAQYYHVLRRQIHRDFRKPLISIQPKSLLRLKQASSKLSDMAADTKFQRVIPEVETWLKPDDQVRKVVFCSGKVYYELVNARKEQNKDDVAIVRVEQIAPFPFDLVAEAVKKYPNASVVWSQEEPKNMGMWGYVNPRIQTATRVLNEKEIRPKYCGRAPSAATATGYGILHKVEQETLIKDTLA